MKAKRKVKLFNVHDKCLEQNHVACCHLVQPNMGKELQRHRGVTNIGAFWF